MNRLNQLGVNTKGSEHLAYQKEILESELNKTQILAEQLTQQILELSIQQDTLEAIAQLAPLQIEAERLQELELVIKLLLEWDSNQDRPRRVVIKFIASKVRNDNTDYLLKLENLLQTLVDIKSPEGIIQKIQFDAGTVLNYFKEVK